MNGAFVRRMTSRAGNPAFGNGMMAGKHELTAHIAMALKADCFRGPRGLNRKSGAVAARSCPARGEAVRWLGLAAGIGVQAARPVTRFATGVFCVGARGHQRRVIRRGKIAVNGVMTLLALFRADIFCARNVGKLNRRGAGGAAGNDCQNKYHSAG